MDQLYTTLNTGQKMPLLGLGVYDMHGAAAEKAIETAIGLGYQLIDTASMYRNEHETGNAIRNSGAARSSLFVTTKVNNTDQGYDATLHAFDTSSRLLNCDYIDLYLVHWPIRATRRDTWKALVHLYQEGRVRAIGVANYTEPFLEELLPETAVVPAVNQVEFSPFLYLQNLLEKCTAAGIQLQAYTPLTRGEKFSDPRLLALAEKYGKTPAQITLRWIVQHGVSAIPKSSSSKRLQENIHIFDFKITAADMAAMDGWNENYRIVDDPVTYL